MPTTTTLANPETLGIVIWPEPKPLVRHPVARKDGRLALDFASDDDRSKFREMCVGKVAGNCQDAARSSCSLKAIDKCRGPRWLRWLGWYPRKPWSEIEACEDKFVEDCMATGSRACHDHADSFCDLVIERSRQE